MKTRKLYWHIGIATLLILFTGQSIAMGNNATKFEWEATESAPRHYPMKVIRGTLIFHGEKEQGLYIPSGGTLKSGWGHPISSHSTGSEPKPLPDRLKIYFFSYAEKQFYEGNFDLPYEKILALFREEHIRTDRQGEESIVPAYSRIMVGIAPGGAVAVWLIAPRYTEVFFGQAQKVDLNPSAAFNLPFKDKQDSDAYIAKQLTNTLKPEEIESLKKNGIPFGLWARYRNRYDWQPTVSKGNSIEHISVDYLNGEAIGNRDLADTKKLNSPKPVPRGVSFGSKLDGDTYFPEVEFNEFETMAAFEKLGANGKKVYLEFDPRLPLTQTKVRLYNDKESIELKKLVAK